MQSDSETEKYKFETRITVGGRIAEHNNVINDGSSINIGKPNIQEIVKTPDDVILQRKTLYPKSEARLNNLTYKCGITTDVIIEFYTDEDSSKPRCWTALSQRYINPKLYNNVYLTNNLPPLCYNQKYVLYPD